MQMLNISAVVCALDPLRFQGIYPYSHKSTRHRAFTTVRLGLYPQASGASLLKKGYPIVDIHESRKEHPSLTLRLTSLDLGTIIIPLWTD